MRVQRLGFPLVTDKPEYKPERYKGNSGVRGNCSICPTCLKLQECRKRVKSGKWLMCEIPDALDMKRARLRVVA